MRRENQKRHGLRRSRVLFAAATAVVAGFAGRASAQNWLGAVSTNWNTAGNWSPSGVPGAGSNPFIAPSTTNSFNVGYDYNGPAIKLNTLTVSTGGGGDIDILNMNSNALSASSEAVGLTGLGEIFQSGGTNTAGILALGFSAGGEGGYEVSGNATLSAAQVFVGGNIESTGGLGVLLVDGGLLNTGSTGTLTVYNTAGTGFTLEAGFVSTGSLNLSGNPALLHWTGGTLSVTNSLVTFDTPANGSVLGPSLTLGAGQDLISVGEQVGISGSGAVTLSGGANSVGNSLLILADNAGSTGTYTINGSGALSAGNEIIGLGGNALFNQSGGTNTVTSSAGELAMGESVGTTATYVLSNGTLSAPFINVGGGNSAGGKGVVTVSGGLLTTGATGTLTVFNTAGSGVTLNGGTISIGSLNLSGNFGLLHWTSGTLNFINSNFNLDIDTAANGGNLASNLTLGAGQVLTSANQENIGSNGTGTLTQTGGSNLVTGELSLGVFSGSSGIYSLSGTGILTDNGDIVGGNGTGLFNQSGGTNTSTFIDAGFNPNSNGTYLLSAGTANATTVQVGDGDPGAKGVLNVSGSGLMNVSGTLFSTNTPGTGMTGITLSGGTINTAALNLNGTASLLNWTGGTLGLTAGVTFDPGAGASTTSAAFGSSLTVGSGKLLNVTGDETIGGTSSFMLTVNGGANEVSGNLDVGTNPNSTGTFDLGGGGSLGVGMGEQVGESGPGIFNQSGGTNTPEFLVLGDGGSTGTFILSGSGTLVTSFGEGIGDTGVGIFNQTGGTHTVASPGVLTLGTESSGSGTYNLSGGTLATPGVIVGGSSSGAGGTGVLTVSNTGVLSVGNLGLQVFGSGRVNLDVPNTATPTLQIIGNGIVNLNGALAINYGSGADPVAVIASYLQSGYSGGSWSGTSGIISTSVAAGSGKPVLSVGYADGNTDNGTPAGPNHIVVQYTLAGDANLDGHVNSADLLAVIQNFNKSGTDWAHGNFTYIASGQSTTSADLLLIIQNFNATLPPPGGSAVAIGGGSTLLATGTTIPLDAATNVRSASVPLPEPTGIAVVAAGAVGLLRRRRRRAGA